MPEEIIKEYKNKEITVVWKPGSCVHSTLCWKQGTGLPNVFNPRIKPWIKAGADSSDNIIKHVKKCPSGALSFYYNDQKKELETISSETKIETVLNGPLLVYGNVVIKDHLGNEIKKSNVTAFCRCGKSQNKPFCDGNHIKNNFEG